MTLPQRGSRSVAVDGIGYRWRVSRRRGSLHLVVEAEAGGALLRCHFEPHDLYRRDETRWRRTRQQRVISSKLVVLVVRHALGNGWQPAAPNTAPLCMHAWEAERFAPFEGVTAEPDECALRELITEQVSNLRFDLSLSPTWRRRLFDAEVGARIDIPLDDGLLSKEVSARGLRFRAWNDGETPDRFVVFGIDSADLPDIVMFTTNNPAFPDG